MNWITKFIKPKLKTLFKKQPKIGEESLWTTCACQELIYKEDLKKNSLTINQNIEKMIIKNPTQWIWTHDRWK